MIPTMLPILLISRTNKAHEKFIDAFIKKHAIHPSGIVTIEKEKQSVSIEQIRDIQKMLSRNTGQIQLVVIHDFDTAREEAQNAFLKTLEEKNDHTFFILVVFSDTKILPTILSRAHIVRTESEDQGVTMIQKLGLLKKTLSLEESLGLTVHITKENALATVDELMVYLNRALLATQDRKGFSKGFAQAIETKKLILENNTNHEYSLDQLLITLFHLGILPTTIDLPEEKVIS
ncbi:hypothetical protein A3H80_03715 [Candidatus Roizmanbacteria bacterium RIFCSPLOWO2_02_FULL_37_19]|uniref:DNA polymerase III delta N-terminal domain-containing protein n=1 Tax=Candidatus Roizmanbacteria bacterium RIFCSPHIGHO2_02_FULL_37_24 TaxID=1802037 RepID=A0A1F7GVL7_9BACT|nr:MAG: hypothetical protein A2862_01805 [Candidatus Roizmanbacteria bacterium RIFCSPHIGHO2_01_FULL_38_41]OGK22923.1 MAG: hypothetical protein A3C24_03625 [Candidatus Roizmanbacteria bacterium RIFCSPHIGHO2_02_FULL_37_24]OGK33623.1 MAG: hypothetical protein A3E10_05160 [Candidatus Roizmanbacteria bacterium RIFCSPHIGHO2_12_FULL_37_23]OGK44972.1 MAG: hypothetical protein A2956_00310 [Candidatus Roizmanbacteria bacterium RIFCSPLOWO2_01_FULL_37_57]OGK55275.1 MAG: hypothetical protein A3H80_03715 [Ca